jgi:hypothetical protein
MAGKDDLPNYADIFTQKSPCVTCPFVKGVERHAPAMQASYASYFLHPVGVTFPCHKSVPKDDDRTTWSAWREGQVICAGGLIFAAKQGRQNSLVRLAVDQGWYDPACHTEADTARVYDTIEDMVGDLPVGDE